MSGNCLPTAVAAETKQANTAVGNYVFDDVKVAIAFAQHGLYMFVPRDTHCVQCGRNNKSLEFAVRRNARAGYCSHSISYLQKKCGVALIRFPERGQQLLAVSSACLRTIIPISCRSSGSTCIPGGRTGPPARPRTSRPTLIPLIP